jgi:hypothetical protein
MSDKKWEVIKTLIIAVAVITAAIILGEAIKQAGWHILEGLSGIANNISTTFSQ